MTRSALELCIAPHHRQAFLERWWEREPLFIGRREPDRFDHLMTRSVFDDLVAHSNLRVPFFRLIKDGEVLAESACTTSRQLGPSRDVGLAHLDRVYDGFGDGTTVVLAALEKLRPALREFCSELATLFGCPVGAHASLAPPNAGELLPRHDTHGVFILQVEGAKRWRIWRDRWRSPDSDAAPAMEVLLEPGDCLYLPGGFIHAAEASHTTSLHLTIEAKVLRWLDVITAAVREPLTSFTTDPDAQRALAFGRRLGGPICAEDDAALAALGARLVAGLDPDRLVALAKSWPAPPPSGDHSGALLRRLADEAAAPTDHRREQA